MYAYFIQVTQLASVYILYIGNTTGECMYSLYSLHYMRVYVYFTQVSQLVNVCIVYTVYTADECIFTLYR